MRVLNDVKLIKHLPECNIEIGNASLWFLSRVTYVSFTRLENLSKIRIR